MENADILYLIFRYLPILSFDNKDTNKCTHLFVFNKLSLTIYTRVLKEREISHSCITCGGNSVLNHECDEDGCQDCFDVYKELWCPSSEGFYINNAMWIICTRCYTYHNVCRRCGLYMNLISHCGYFYCNACEKFPEKVIKNHCSEDSSLELDDYKPGDNIKYFNTKLAAITGPDGGLVHSWICKNEKCEDYNVRYDYSDK